MPEKCAICFIVLSKTDSVNFLFSLDTKVASANKLFFYSFTMNVTDGYGAYALS